MIDNNDIYDDYNYGNISVDNECDDNDEKEGNNDKSDNDHNYTNDINDDRDDDGLKIGPAKKTIQLLPDFQHLLVIRTFLLDGRKGLVLNGFHDYAN